MMVLCTELSMKVMIVECETVSFLVHESCSLKEVNELEIVKNVST